MATNAALGIPTTLDEFQDIVLIYFDAFEGCCFILFYFLALELNLFLSFYRLVVVVFFLGGIRAFGLGGVLFGFFYGKIGFLEGWVGAGWCGDGLVFCRGSAWLIGFGLVLSLGFWGLEGCEI